jgi:hypothetical protein
MKPTALLRSEESLLALVGSTQSFYVGDEVVLFDGYKTVDPVFFRFLSNRAGTPCRKMLAR